MIACKSLRPSQGWLLINYCCKGSSPNVSPQTQVTHNSYGSGSNLIVNRRLFQHVNSPSVCAPVKMPFYTSPVLSPHSHYLELMPSTSHFEIKKDYPRYPPSKGYYHISKDIDQQNIFSLSISKRTSHFSTVTQFHPHKHINTQIKCLHQPHPHLRQAQGDHLAIDPPKHITTLTEPLSISKTTGQTTAL